MRTPKDKEPVFSIAPDVVLLRQTLVPVAAQKRHLKLHHVVAQRVQPGMIASKKISQQPAA